MDATAEAVAASRAKDVQRSSLCNCVVNFLLQEGYLLTAFELLHELVEDGRHDQAIRLRDFFSDPSLFPPDLISRFNSLRVADPQTLLEEKIAAEEKLAISEYELRLAQEDLTKLQLKLQKMAESPVVIESEGACLDISVAVDPENQHPKKERSFVDLGPLKDMERRNLNCAVKEYLLFAGYRLTAMTFYEEVTDQNLDIWPNGPACVSDALRHYYYQYLSSTADAAEEKINMLRENESLTKETEKLNSEKTSLLKAKELADGQITILTKSLDAGQKDLKEKEGLVQDLKQSLEAQRKELNDCRAEITSLKMFIEGTRSGRQWTHGEHDVPRVLHVENHKGDVESSHSELEHSELSSTTMKPETVINTSVDAQPEERDIEIYENTEVMPTSEMSIDKPDNKTLVPFVHSSNGAEVNVKENSHEHIIPEKVDGIVCKPESPRRDTTPNKMALDTIQILSDALPKIVPYVLINHREELLPLIMCAIERHPDSNVRDSLTHTLFNLIKRPDEQQRRIIMDACVSLAKNVGEMRTETELLPQCWEQINHKYEERRLLVAQSCGELAEFVRPEIRDSLILSIVQQLVEDSATVVREAAAHNLALLLPLFPNMDKYFKVEELMFQLVCDPSGVVVDTTLKDLVHAVIKWGSKLEHVLRVLLSHLLGSAQRCPPISGVEGSVESQLRVLGERERWNIDVLLRMLIELLPFVHQKAIETCPFTSTETPSTEPSNTFFSISLLQLYAGGHVDWPAFDWLHIDCFPDIIQLACLLPHKEDNLRNRMTKFLLDVPNCFGNHYLTHIMLPVFLVAVGDDADLSFFPSSTQSRIKGLQPKTVLTEKLAVMCVLPLLLSGILGSPAKREQLSEYLRKMLVQSTVKEGSVSSNFTTELLNAIRFLCTFEEHHGIIFNISWEMVVSSNINMKIFAANLLKILVPYIDVKVASTHVVPALVTLGSDQNLNVKYASIEAFGAVAQQFKSDTIVDKIRIQMDAFLEDGSHEATLSVVRALLVAIFQLTALPVPGNDVMRRRERANAFCEAIRALDATDLSPTSIKDFLLPAIQNLLKDQDALDPAHKEALEVIMKERSGGTFEAISKVMGVNLGLASSVTSFFGDSGPQISPQPQDDTRFRRIMRGNFGDMLRGKGKGLDESPGQSG
ncbi:hypothetical protein J5N97_027789 [Dioscorea zingiberensis]|uniref:HEAT repeat-containing protein n=1 Tax=Dioscorea zingiberensis TaxID=325984 RepID=A0A9D5BXS9_9LILI|nr:hypothetical protein J5N97_027789 [Dioscorea zingiberensis]